MLWESVKCECCVLECWDRPYPGTVSTQKKYFWVASIRKTTFATKSIYIMEYLIYYEHLYLRDTRVVSGFRGSKCL